jgi:hypothetical protein
VTHRLKCASIGVSFSLLCPVLAHATPITYNATLQSGIPVTGQIAASNRYDEPVGAQYYLFHAGSGDEVEVAGSRLWWGYDMAFWIYEGQFTDTSAFGYRFDDDDPGYVGFYDDEVDRFGPWGDPLAQFVAPSTGPYTVAVTNYLSSAYGFSSFGPSAFSGFSGLSPQCYDPRLYPFQLVAVMPTSVPEPTGVLWLGFGLAFLRFVGRRLHR